MLTIFDTHTHLNLPDFADKESEELTLAQELGVTKMNIVGFDRPSILQALALAEHNENLYATIGWHPTEAGRYSTEVADFLKQHLSHQKVIALGEIGLDYHWMTASKAQQAEVFAEQLALAKEYSLPFVVHTREALEDTYQQIKAAGTFPRGGIIHSYSGSWEMAERFIELGLMISFSGVVTFKKALDVQEAAQKLPLDKILVETDAPYLAPVPKRGHKNRPAYARYVVEQIAKLRQLPTETVAKATYDNAMKVFGLADET